MYNILCITQTLVDYCMTVRIRLKIIVGLRDCNGFATNCAGQNNPTTVLAVYIGLRLVVYRSWSLSSIEAGVYRL